MPNPPANVTVDNIVITPSHIMPGDSVTIKFDITSDTSLSGFKIALYCKIDDVNYLATPIINGTSVTANTPKTVTLTSTASARTATVDGRITAFAAGENNSIHDVPLYLGFREISPLVIGANLISAGTGEFWAENTNVASAFGASANPSIENLLIERASYNNETNMFYLDDEGERAFVSCKLALGDESAASGFECWLTWGNNSSRVCAGIAMSLYNRGTGMWSYGYEWLFGGLERDYCILYNYSFDADNWTTFTCTYSDAYESVSKTFILTPAFANVHLSGTGKGVAFGKFSSSTEGNPLFECEYPAQFGSNASISGNASITGDTSFGGNVAVGSGKLLKVVNVAVASSVSIAGGSSGEYEVTVNPGAGWTPICTTGTRCNNGRIVMRRVYLTGTKVHVEPVNTGTSTYTIAISADVLCVRTSL